MPATIASAISAHTAYGPCGCDLGMLQLTVAAEIPEIKWPLSPDVVPPMPAVMNLLEFPHGTNQRAAAKLTVSANRTQDIRSTMWIGFR